MLLRMIAADNGISRGSLLVPGVALLTLVGPKQNGSPFDITVAGRTPRPPYGTVDVHGERTPIRIAAFRVPNSGAQDAELSLVDGNGEHHVLAASELDPDPLAITAGWDAAAKRKLLDFLLTFCCAAFRLQHSAAFARTCARLAIDCVEVAGDARAVAQVTSDHVLVAGLHAAADASLFLLGQSNVTASRLHTLASEVGLQVVPQPIAGDLIVAAGKQLHYWVYEARAGMPHVLFLPESGTVSGSAARAACGQALATNRSTMARMLLQDIGLFYPAEPRRIADPARPVAGDVELAIPDGGGGLFLSGWLRDPLERINHMHVAAGTSRVALPPDALLRVRRPDVEKQFAGTAYAGHQPDGFVLHVAEMPGGPTVQPHLLLRLHSGAEVRLTPTARSMPAASARDAVLGCVSAGQLTPAIMRRGIAPATERLHRAAMTRTGDPDVIRLGLAIAKPAISIIVPLYRNLSFLRLQLAALAEDARARKAEIIFVLDSPEQRSDCEHLLRGLYGLLCISTSLVVMARNLGYAAACNAGAGLATAPLLLLLNSDVIPVSPGWLALMMAPFSNRLVAATGPKLLFDDGSIQHAGLFFERDAERLWFNRHYHKGMPRHWARASERRVVPGVTGAALMVRRSMFEWVGGVCEDYVIGDYEDSDFCLRLRESGGSTVYVPGAELFHFERRSIQLHQGYTRTHAALYNRLLHHDRWDATMDAAMAEVGGPALGRAA